MQQIFHFLQCADAALIPFLKEELAKRGKFVSKEEFAALTKPEQNELCNKIDCLVAIGRSVLTAEQLAYFPRLKLVAVCGAGFDRIDIDACRQRKILVSNTPHVSSIDVAEHALWMIFTLLRRGIEAQKFVVSGKWLHEGGFPLGHRIAGKKLGVVGLGNIGKEIALRATALGMEVAYYSRNRKNCQWHYFSDIKALAKWSDILVIAMAASADNYHMINRTVLESLGSSGFLVNIARGSLVDESVLLDMLKKRELAGCALDVYQQEPWQPSTDVAPYMLCTPHIASATHEARLDMAKLTLSNIDAMMQGKDLITPV